MSKATHQDQDIEPETQDETPVELPAILVMRQGDQIRISEHNGIDSYSVPALLRKAANVYEARLLSE